MNIKFFDVNKNSHSVKCKLYFNKPREISDAVLFIHGFGGHKDNRAAERFAKTFLSKKKGGAVLTFDLPNHGDDVKRKLTLEDCETYISLVIEYINTVIKPQKLYAYATSFGAYLLLKYVSEHGSPFYRTALRCPALPMHRVLLGSIADEEELNSLKKGKTISVGFDRKVNIGRNFAEVLKACDVTKADFSSLSENILIIQGTKDEVVPPENVKAFAEKNDILYIESENADHRFQDFALMGRAINDIIDFFDA